MKNKIMLIEDDLMLSDLTCEMLNMIGFETYAADNINNSIEMFTEKKEEIKIIIFDMNLESHTGKEVLDALLKINDEFVPILATGMVIESEIQKYKDMGFSEVMIKPYNLKSLKDIAEKYIK